MSSPQRQRPLPRSNEPLQPPQPPQPPARRRNRNQEKKGYTRFGVTFLLYLIFTPLIISTYINLYNAMESSVDSNECDSIRGKWTVLKDYDGQAQWLTAGLIVSMCLSLIMIFMLLAIPVNPGRVNVLSVAFMLSVFLIDVLLFNHIVRPRRHHYATPNNVESYISTPESDVCFQDLGMSSQIRSMIVVHHVLFAIGFILNMVVFIPRKP